MTEIQQRADFSTIRYAQCWEDSSVLIRALQPAGRHCLSIGSAGDNSFALIGAGAASVTAVEMNPAQVACIELRRAAYLSLDHAEFLALVGSRPHPDRFALYVKCREALVDNARVFWDGRPQAIAEGIGAAGKFERYFKMFREWVLPLAHGRPQVDALLLPRTLAERDAFYDRVWNNRRWRAIFHIFFSRTVMGLGGRDPEFFRYVDGPVAERILERTHHALTALDPSANPYLHWILTGTHGTTLPDALEAGNFERIGEALRSGGFTITQAPLERWLADHDPLRYDAFNLSDIFEYMNEANTTALLTTLADHANPGARLAYWNMLAPRSRPASMQDRLRSLDDEAAELFAIDRAFFYSRFVIEEVIG